MNTDEIQDRLIKNAFDFLITAVSEFEERPKYSVIHFAAAVELFLKARLLMEHWTLVIAKGKEASVKSFLAGDFLSVNLETAFSRLGDIIQSPLSKEQKESFSEIAKHRNKVIHFYHEAVDKDSDAALKTTIAKEQCIAWYHLKHLLAHTWQEHFISYKEDLDRASHAMLLRQSYLQIAFEKVENDIAARETKGQDITECPVCGFKALACDPVSDRIAIGTCLVCSRNSNVLAIDCTACGKQVKVVGDGWCRCPECDGEFIPEDILIFLTGDANLTKEDSTGQILPHCTLCKVPYGVFKVDDGHYFCTNCFDIADTTYECEYCHAINTHDLDFSYLEGCAVCSGQLGSQS